MARKNNNDLFCIDEHISDYNTDFYYQPRDYIAACYEEGEIL